MILKIRGYDDINVNVFQNEINKTNAYIALPKQLLNKAIAKSDTTLVTPGVRETP